MRSFRIPLRVVFYRQDGQWVAHCLEFDLCGDGETKELAIESLSAAISTQIVESVRRNNPRNLFSPADSDIHAKFFAGRHTAHGELTVEKIDDVVIEPTEYREYTEDSDCGLAMA